jgi:hypothetical protein
LGADGNQLEDKYHNPLFDPAKPTAELVQMANKPIAEAEQSISRANVEHAAVYKDGHQLFIRTDASVNGVNFTPAEMKSMRDATFTHNHPIGDDGKPITFSRNDLTLMCFTHMAEMRAVSGDTVFSFKPPADTKLWDIKPKALQKYLTDSLTTVVREHGLADIESMRNSSGGKINECMDDLWKRIDQQLRIGYSSSRR